MRSDAHKIMENTIANSSELSLKSDVQIFVQHVSWQRDMCMSLCVWLLTFIPCIAGTILGQSLMEPKGNWFSPPRTAKHSNSIVESLGQWDSHWYLAISQDDYFYHPQRMSSINFYPIYPCLIALLHGIYPFRMKVHETGIA